MLAGLAAAGEEGLSLPARLLPLAACFLLFFFGRGNKGLFAVNLALVPLILAFIFSMAGQPWEAGMQGAESDAFSCLSGVLAYVCMNCFPRRSAHLRCGRVGRRGYGVRDRRTRHGRVRRHSACQDLFGRGGAGDADARARPPFWRGEGALFLRVRGGDLDDAVFVVVPAGHSLCKKTARRNLARRPACGSFPALAVRIKAHCALCVSSHRRRRGDFPRRVHRTESATF